MSRAEEPANVQPRPRVAVVSSVHRWNDTRIYVKQVRSLAQAGFDVTLVGVAAEQMPTGGEEIRIVTLPRRRRAVRWLNWLAILRLVMRSKPRIVHAHDPELFPLLVVLRWFGYRVICDVHEDVAEQVLHKEWMPRPLRPVISGAIRAMQRLLPGAVNAVIIAEDAYARNFPPRPNIVVVRNFPLLSPTFKTSYETSTFRLVYVGDVRIVRGVETYVRTTKRLVEQGVPVELRIVGSFADKSEEQRMRELVRELQIEPNVIWYGRRHPREVPAILTECDIGLALLHAIGNYRESYPTKMFEYMAAGLPSLVSDFPLWSAVLIENDCGRVVDPTRIDDATEILLEYWRSPELRERHGRNGRRAVTERYQWEIEAERLRGLYARLV